MAPLERSWEKMNRLAWGAFNWPHSSPRKAQSTQWEEKEEALSFLAVGGLQGPHWSLCSGQAGFWLSGPWLTMALAYKGKHGTVSRRMVVSNETSRKPQPNPTKTETQYRCYMPLSRGWQRAPCEPRESSTVPRAFQTQDACVLSCYRAGVTFE